MKFAGWVLAFCFLLIAGCDSSEPEPVVIDIPDPRFVPDSSYTVTASGLKYFDFSVGDTTQVTADQGDIVQLLYAGWLSDGRFFDGSATSGPLQFLVGNNNVIAGLDEGVLGMHLQGDRQIVIPPELGYGSEDNEVIPGGSTLIFEVVLIASQ